MDDKNHIKKSQNVKHLSTRQMASEFKPQVLGKLQLSEKGDSIVTFLFATLMILALVIVYFSFFQQIQGKEELIVEEFRKRWK